MKLKLLFVITITLSLFGCGTNKPATDSGPLFDKNLKLFTYGAPYKALEKKLRLIHGRQLSSALSQQKLFASTEYAGDGRDISGYDTILRVTFLYAQQGSSEWPLEIKAHYILESEGTTLFNQVYQVKATQLKAPSVCSGCSAEDTALKMLVNKVTPELKLALTQ